MISKSMKYTNKNLYISLLIFLFLFSLGFIYVFVNTPKSAAMDFGPPSKDISKSQVFLYSLRLYVNKPSIIKPVESNKINEEIFIVDIGEPVASIAYNLENLGLINNPKAFIYYLIYSGIDTQIQAGEYRLSASMNAIEIAHELMDATSPDVEFVILPGWRLEEIAGTLPTSGLEISPEEFIDIAKNPPNALLPERLSEISSLEGFMFPDTYVFSRTIKIDEFISEILNRFLENIPPEIEVSFSEKGLSLQDAIALASIVEREAIIIDEQPLIASVFLNRLNIGMKLDSDPTVQYSIGYDREKNNWWKNPLTYADLQINSLYNTYIFAGLPPAPICNPSKSAINSVALPSETTYYYFRAKCDSSSRHNFSETLSEHIEYECSIN